MALPLAAIGAGIGLVDSIGGLFSGLGGGHPKDAERIRAAQDALQKALNGDQAAYTYMMQQAGLAGPQYGSATQVGKDAFKKALDYLQQQGGVGAGTRAPQGMSLPSSTGNPILDAINSVAGIVGNSPIGDAARQLNGGQAITLENLLGGATKNITEGLGGIANKIGDLATSNAGLTGLGIAQGINAANLQKQSNQYAKDALGTVQQSYNERAPLRAQGIQGLLNPKVPDTSELTNIRGRIAQSAPSTSGLPQTMGAGTVQPIAAMLKAPGDLSGGAKVSNPQSLQAIQGMLKMPAAKPLPSMGNVPQPVSINKAQSLRKTVQAGNPYATQNIPQAIQMTQ